MTNNNFVNGEHWRIITPIFLCVLGILSTMNITILKGIETNISKNTNMIEGITDKLNDHLQKPDIHYGLKKDVEWLKNGRATSGTKGI